MGKIIIIGNSLSEDLAEKLNAKLLEVPNLLSNDFAAVNDFVLEELSDKFDVLIIDADRIRPDLALAIGVYMRLSIPEIRENALNPIVFATDKRLKSYLHYKTFSQLLLTKEVYFQSRSEILIDELKPISPNNYNLDFLDYICIKSEQGRHSLANQWGASIIDKIENDGNRSNYEEFINAEKSLYFKYLNVKNINIVDYLSGKKERDYLINRQQIKAEGKHILLIDDEASKGWEYVLRRLIKVEKEEDFRCINYRVKDYKSFPQEEKKLIKDGWFDLVFLDLRMNGMEEKDIYKPSDFSGMKILSGIKEDSPGTQVIIFTASNKAWNLKALLDEGADGYYIKESPEYNFSFGFSLANFDALCNLIKECLSRSYLRDANKIICRITRDFNQTNNVKTNFKRSIIKQLELSYTLLYAKRFEFAFVTLCQIIEMINDEYLDRDDDGTWYIKENAEDAKNWEITIKRECIECSFDDKYEKYPEWKKISSLFYQLWKQNDKSFGYQMRTLIKQRNDFMHNDSDKRAEIHSEKGYMTLLEYISNVCLFI